MQGAGLGLCPGSRFLSRRYAQDLSPRPWIRAPMLPGAPVPASWAGQLGEVLWSRSQGGMLGRGPCPLRVKVPVPGLPSRSRMVLWEPVPVPRSHPGSRPPSPPRRPGRHRGPRSRGSPRRHRRGRAGPSAAEQRGAGRTRRLCRGAGPGRRAAPSPPSPPLPVPAPSPMAALGDTARLAAAAQRGAAAL